MHDLNLTSVNNDIFKKKFDLQRSNSANKYVFCQTSIVRIDLCVVKYGFSCFFSPQRKVEVQIIAKNG